MPVMSVRKTNNRMRKKNENLDDIKNENSITSFIKTNKSLVEKENNFNSITSERQIKKQLMGETEQKISSNLKKVLKRIASKKLAGGSLDLRQL